MPSNLERVFTMDEPERTSRLRELRMATLMLTGPKSEAVTAMTIAVHDPTALTLVIGTINKMPALPKRRLLALLAAVL